MVSLPLPEPSTALHSLHHIKVDLLRLVLGFSKEVGRHDVPFIGDHFENVGSGQKLCCANHRNIIIWDFLKVLARSYTVDFRKCADNLFGHVAPMEGHNNHCAALLLCGYFAYFIVNSR